GPTGKAQSFNNMPWPLVLNLKPISELPTSMDLKSLTVSFLRNSCGFSLELAVSTFKKLNIENIENPNSVLDLLRTHSLEQNHIRYLISSRPLLLLTDLGNTLKPNMELFKSLGFCGASLAEMLSKYPAMLESDAYATVEFFRAHGFSEKQIKTLTMKLPALYTYNANKSFMPKLEFFKSLGLSNLEIAEILSASPLVLQTSLEKQIIPTWEAFRSFGLSEDEIYAAFKRQPLCMGCSEKKIKKMMGFFVNKLKMKPSRISKTPILLQFSLEKRIIPRCSVLQVLMFKGLITEHTSIVSILKMVEKEFMEKFVSKYQNEVPDVVRAHQGKIEFQGLPIAPMET
ncbi:hypothetical protein I3760_12G035500, partial [Carya illinoinensis]